MVYPRFSIALPKSRFLRSDGKFTLLNLLLPTQAVSLYRKIMLWDAKNAYQLRTRQKRSNGLKQSAFTRSRHHLAHPIHCIATDIVRLYNISSERARTVDAVSGRWLQKEMVLVAGAVLSTLFAGFNFFQPPPDHPCVHNLWSSWIEELLQLLPD